TLLRWAVRLEPHLVRIDDDRAKLEVGQGPRDVEARCPGLERHARLRRQIVGLTQARESLRRRGHRPARDHHPCVVLDHERRELAVHIKADIVGSHWAVLLAPPSWGVLCVLMVYRAPYRGAGRPASCLHLYGSVDTYPLREERGPMPRTGRPYSAEFRQRLVELVRGGQSPEELAGKFEPSANAIRKWVVQAARDEGRRADGLTTDEKEEIWRLRREVRGLR